MKSLLLGAALAALFAVPAFAEDANVKVVLKDHRFVPQEISAPAGKSVVIVLTNQDTTPAEFESKTLRVEKLLPAGGTVSVRVRALEAGRYRFFDDYHEDTTEGFLNVK